MPTFVLGKQAYVAIGTSGSETDVSSYVKAADPANKVNALDTTTFGTSNHKTAAPGLIEDTVKITMLWNQTLDAILRPLLGVVSKSLIVGPQGNTTGQVKETYPGFLSNFSRKITPGGIIEADCEFHISADPTFGVF